MIQMQHIEGSDRNQMFFASLEDLVSVNSWARVVDLFVDTLPLKELGFKHVELKSEGRPPYNPAMMLKLYLYGYKHGVRTSRRLEQACRTNVELWWLLKNLKPSARAVLYFRKDNTKAFKNAFRHFVLILKDWELIDGDEIAIDSFKIRAQNSLKNNFNQKKLDRHKEYIDKKIEEYEEQLKNEESDDKRDQINYKIDHQKSQKSKYEKIEQDLKYSGEQQISLNDPDAKSVVLHRNIVNVGYNIQAGSDAKYKFLLYNDTGHVNDTKDLAPMSIAIKEMLNKESLNVLADKGYNTGDQLQKCKENNIITYASPKASSSPPNGCYPIEMFKYNPVDDTYSCPAKQILVTNGSYYQKGNYRVKHYKTKACKTCNKYQECSTNKTGRLIERSEHQEVIEENRKRVESNPEYYRNRQQITEHQFGTMKRQWGFTFTLVKGKANVLSEVNLFFIVYNLTRLINVIGKDEMKRRFKILFHKYSSILWQIQAFLSPYNKHCLLTEKIEYFKWT